MKRLLPILLLFVSVFAISCKQESLEEKIQENIHKGFLEIVTHGLDIDITGIELQKTEIIQIDTINVDNFFYKKRILEEGNLFFVLNAKNASLKERLDLYNMIANDTTFNKTSPILGYLTITKATFLLPGQIEESSYAPILVKSNFNLVRSIDELKE